MGSIALALILFDGGLRTRFATFRSVLAPSAVLATVGVLLTAMLTAPVAKYLLGMNWVEALLVGAVVASTDAAAVFFLINAGGLRLRTRVGATLEAESGSNDPFAVLLTILLVEYLTVGAGIVVARARGAGPAGRAWHRARHSRRPGDGATCSTASISRRACTRRSSPRP